MTTYTYCTPVGRIVIDAPDQRTAQSALRAGVGHYSRQALLINRRGHRWVRPFQGIPKSRLDRFNERTIRDAR